MANRRRALSLQAIAIGAVVLLFSASAPAQTQAFVLDARQSTVTFTLGATLHTVHGVFQLKSGHLDFDLATGSASGLLVVDATSGDSGSAARDRKMHKDILESAKFPEIAFAPHHISGQLPHDGAGEVTISGTMTLHGQPHEISIVSRVTVHSGEAAADMKFVVPYVQWGLKNPSTFILRVSDKVEIDVHAVGKLQ